MRDDKHSVHDVKDARAVAAPRGKPFSLRLGLLAMFMAGAWLALACGAPQGPPAELKKQPAGDYAWMNTNLGDMIFRLYTDKMPMTAGNFIGLANGLREYYDPYAKKIVTGHFYDGLIFFRLAPDFVVQGGDICNTGAGNPGFQLKDEKAPSLKFDKRGTLAMANRSMPNSSGSQFFVTFNPSPTLNGHYAIIGELVYGESTLKAIQSTPLNRFQAETPLNKITLRVARVYHVGADGSATLTQMPPAAAGLPKAVLPVPNKATQDDIAKTEGPQP
jgi:peptidyl-prolyl cis-trans isomerase A (cyclophilin A)